MLNLRKLGFPMININNFKLIMVLNLFFRKSGLRFYSKTSKNDGFIIFTPEAVLGALQNNQPDLAHVVV